MASLSIIIIDVAPPSPPRAPGLRFEPGPALSYAQRVSKRSIGYVVFVLLILGGWESYVDTLLDCGVYKVQGTPSVTHQQIHCHPQSS